MVFELKCVGVILVFIGAVKKICCAKTHKSRLAEAGAFTGRPGRTAAGRFQGEKPEQTVPASTQHTDPHNALWKD